MSDAESAPEKESAGQAAPIAAAGARGDLSGGGPAPAPTEGSGAQARTGAVTKPEAALSPATFLQKLVLVIYLVGSTLALLYFGAHTLEALDPRLVVEVSVPWKRPASVTLSNGPASFWHDDKGHQIMHRGPIDDALKQRLIALAVATTGADAPAALEDYRKAIDQLAFEAKADRVGVAWRNEKGRKLKPSPTWFWYDRTSGILFTKKPVTDRLKTELLALEVDPSKDDASYAMAIDRLAFVTSRPPDAFLVVLTVAAMGGMLGVQLRSIVNFIGIACIKNVLDVPRWWPWYWLRPVLGVLLGILLVVLIKTRLFTSPLEQAADDSLWWLGMTILVGFGSSEFTERLRLLTQTLFGKS